ncbi:MAG: glycosyltransferase family 39 protein [Gemmatimonadota bacterium]
MTPNQWQGASIALVVGVAACFVWLGFTPVPHTGGDNAGYVALAHGLLDGAGYTDVFDPEGLPHTKYPPLFPAFLAAMVGLGAKSWAALKWSAALPTILTVLLTYLWAERRVGRLPALGVSTLVAASSAFVYYAHWVLSDPLFIALTMGALYAFSRSLADPTDGESERPLVPVWLAVGVVCTGLAYFTRSAGLPLVVAVLAWLALRREWRPLAAAAGGLGLPMLLWSIRGRGEGVAQYGTEFWMVNPYEPELGTIGVAGLIPRAFENGEAYLLQHLPAGIVGAGGPALPWIGVGLIVVALVGWALSSRDDLGVTELFLPLYVGLILLWPAVWGGDRFALPLFPIVFLYGVVAIRRLGDRVPIPAMRAVGALVFLGLFLPATASTLDAREQNRTCASFAAANGPWACYGPRVSSFVEAARWTTRGLPEGAAVLSRKPRHFYAQSGVPSRAFAFSDDPDEQLALADRLGARYVLLDQWDGLAARYVAGAVQRRPSAFCYIRAFGDPAQGGAQLLGVLPAGARTSNSVETGLVPCPDEYVRSAEAENYSSSSGIPLLEGDDS